jgi:hypothetical protein
MRSARYAAPCGTTLTNLSFTSQSKVTVNHKGLNQFDCPAATPFAPIPMVELPVMPQMEQDAVPSDSAVNRLVAGSNPARGASVFKYLSDFLIA